MTGPRCRLSSSSSPGGPVRILAEASSSGSATIAVALSSWAVGGRVSAHRPGAMRSAKASRAASFSSLSVIGRALPSTITER